MSGELATQTPPWPTAMPEGMFSPSAKTVNLSALPSPSVSSRTLTRSRPGPGSRAGILEALGDPDPAPLVERHRHRVDDVRLAGDDLDPEPRRHGHRLDRLGGRSRRVGGASWAWGMSSARGAGPWALAGLPTSGRPSDQRPPPRGRADATRHVLRFRPFHRCTQEFATSIRSCIMGVEAFPAVRASGRIRSWLMNSGDPHSTWPCTGTGNRRSAGSCSLRACAKTAARR